MKFRLSLLVIFITMLIITGCGMTDATSPTGWWEYEHRITGIEVTPPFEFMEITEEGVVYLYSATGEVNDEGTFSFKDGIIIYDEVTLESNTQYDVNMTIEQDVQYMVLTGEHFYRFLEGNPEFSSSNEELEVEVMPYDPFDEADGFWIIDEFDTDTPYAYLEKIGGYMITYDQDGFVTNEDGFYYDQNGGLYNGAFDFYSIGFSVGYGIYGDIERFVLDDVYYHRINELPFEKETFSPVGEWHLSGVRHILPFEEIEILAESHEDDGNVICIDENGDVLDIGYLDYNEVQGDVFGKPVSVVSFPNIGMYALYLNLDGNMIYFAEILGWESEGVDAQFVEFSRQSSIDDRLSIDDSTSFLLDILAEEAEGKSLVETGEEQINEEMYIIFALGTDTPEKFIAEKHFAVNTNGDILIMEFTGESIWVKYEY